MDDLPLKELLRGLSFNGLSIPELIAIDSIAALRPYLRFMWLLPIGADACPKSAYHRLSPPMPEGLTMVDSGYTFASLPEDLDECDRAALEVFWQSERCLQFLHDLYECVQKERQKIILSEASEDQLLARWFMGEATRRDRALEAEIMSLMMERGMIPSLKK